MYYTYDSAGRRASVAAGTSGNFDPTEYTYSTTTGLLEKVRYYSGVSYHDAEYFYDSMARLNKIEDWLGGNGLRYAYDAAGRLTTITDYDDSTLDYTYDAAGNVTNMDDYHGNDTSYVYDDAGRLTSMTAPGSKTWTFAYNALNQPTVETLPNGMASFYTYDTLNRLEKIDHKDAAVSGNTVLSFDYTLDDDGNITRIDENDGGFWEYAYDGRSRLIDAVYTTPDGHDAVYDYTYDDGDNMTQKVEPFQEDFNDENYTGWTTTGTWSASGGYVKNTVNTGGLSQFYRLRGEEDGEIRFSYYSENTSNSAYFLRALFRSNDDVSKIEARFAPNQALLMEYVIGTGWVTRDTEATATTTQAVWYDVLVKLDGADVTVWHGERGQELQEILSTTSSTTTATQYLTFAVPANAQFRLDDANIIDGVTLSTWTMTSNDANELTQMSNTAQGATIDYTYDAMGRTTEKTLGAKTAEYDWRYDSKLYSVDSDFIDEGDVTYDYGADGKRRSRTAEGVSTGYNWDRGWNVIQEEDATNALAKSFIVLPSIYTAAPLAELEGSSPSSATVSYYTHDHLGSIRGRNNHSNTLHSKIDFSPFGENQLGDHESVSGFTGLEWDDTAKAFLTPFRHYFPSTMRWSARDPLGFSFNQNLYSYVNGSPISSTDRLGLCPVQEDDDCDAILEGCRSRANNAYLRRMERIKKEFTQCTIITYGVCFTVCMTGCGGFPPLFPVCITSCGAACTLAGLGYCTDKLNEKTLKASIDLSEKLNECIDGASECMRTGKWPS